MASDLKDTKAELATTQGELDKVKGDLDKAKGDLETIAGDLPAREEAVSKKESDLDQREVDLDQRKDDLKAAEADVTAREKKVGLIETTIANNTVDGEGLYKVGADIKAGTYKTAGKVGCYYAVLNSTDTMDIADNNNIDGPGYVTIGAGQYFESSGCADWVLSQ